MAMRSGQRGASAGLRKRPPLRREMIVSAASQLFRAQGFRGTRIEDIGTAVGMTGPAVYRHFPSKEALLSELLQRAVERARRDLHTAVEARLPARDTLERLVTSAVEQAIEESDLVVMAGREAHDLSPAVRKRVGRKQREIVEGWARALRAVRSDLDDERARAVVSGVAALITSCSHQRAMEPDVARLLYTRMAMAALTAR